VSRLGGAYFAGQLAAVLADGRRWYIELLRVELRCGQKAEIQEGLLNLHHATAALIHTLQRLI